jgi:hypothetical protein
MNAAHTPGPWAWSEDGYDLRPTDESKGAVVVIATTDGMLVRSYNRNGIEASLAEVDANKQLIGASPDMLAALIVAREFISTDRNAFAEANTPPGRDKPIDRYDRDVLTDYDAALLQIDAAIAKATGGAA